MSARYTIAASLLFLAAAVPAADRLLPVAVASTAAGTVVLNADGRVLVADPKPGSGLRAVCRNYNVVFDMAAGQWNGQTSIFVVGLADNRKLSLVTEYSPQGKQLRTWSQLGGPLYGIGLDSSSNTLYVTGGDSNIYTVTEASKSFGHVASVTGINHIGSITVDSRYGRLFVATTDDGSVYTLDKAGQNQRKLAQGLGNLSALAYDAADSTLYASDAKGFVWRWNPDQQAPPKKMTISVRLRQPLGLALVPGSAGGPDLLVGDQNASCVYRISAAGAILQQIR
jgi:WD40 repeat protein